MIESHDGETSLAGSPIKSGYQSHFVVTNADGRCVYEDSKDELFNEIAISQDIQTVPAFIIHIEKSQVNDVFHRLMPGGGQTTMNFSSQSQSQLGTIEVCARVHPHT